MPRQDKVAVVERLTERLGRSGGVILTNYRGLNVAQLGELRKRLRQTGVDYQVAKNTLARRAAEAAGMPELQDALTGPVGIAFAYEDPAAASRLLFAYSREQRNLVVVGGMLGKTLLNAAEVRALADLPDLHTMLGATLGTLNAPLSQLLGTTQGLLRDCLGLFTAYHDQLSAA